MTKKKIILIDGNSLAYRAFFALPLLTNDHGIHTNAVYGFTMMLQNILQEEKPTHMLVAWDAGKTTFRHKTFEEYKGGRQKTPSELSEQFPYIRKLLDAYNIKQYELDQFEADDIIGTLSREGNEAGVEVVVFSGDKDLTQLATEHTTVLITRRGITDTEKYTPEHIIEKYGITASQMIDMMGLMGDPSDNIPGVPGVGEKTAIKLLKEYGSIENVYKSLDKITAKKLNENLTANEEIAYMSRDLATIVVDAPITVKIDELSYDGPDNEALTSIFQQLNFNTLLEKISPGASVVPQEDIDVTIVKELTEEHLSDAMALHVEMMDENYLNADILGIALADENRTIYLPFSVVKSSDLFITWLQDETKKKYCSDSKAALASLARYGIELKGIEFDLLLGAYIVSPSTSYTDIASIVKQFGYTDVKQNELIYGKGAKKAAPSDEIVAEHASRSALAVWTLRSTIEEKLKENEQFDLYHELELPLATILGKMESTGVKTDKQALAEIGTQLSVKIKELETSIYEMAGEKFNVNSPKQLGVILFEKIGLTPIKKTKTGYSTAADVLEKLESEHEIIGEILQYRQLAKLNSTYIEGLLREIHEDGKIHTRFQQALTTTGRLSSINPNLQNIPVRLEEGRKIRAAFVPSEPEWLLFAADYSQIELRVLAHMSQDEKLMEAFHQGEDIHTKTAADVFGVSIDEVTSSMRDAAKAVNFGIIYGISDYGLSQNLNITRKEAAKFIETYLASFPGVKQYMDDSVAEAKVNGYVTTLMNRRRYLPEIKSSNFNIRSFAERTAMNTPIQGSAADIIKQAMIDMAVRLEAEGLQTRMLLQVHDELIFEAPADEIELLKKIVPEVMESAFKLDVPLKVESAYGDSWYDMK
ncbi:DNA polymerase I [Sporosarcina sp. Marseille-Q4063]|uniref:DNA polymerase I n=1 Tax=Sporosarcina sp. Marseille-Q4063 TaxID=2810514 RepID=UPI001BB0D57D|nr:DNA polymerase I [Sporosarcina sp. Marseille-Q4063]QUW22689.1 DNA polymerase I [Sporosarcina sp. Marseille-Q4063]